MTSKSDVRIEVIIVAFTGIDFHAYLTAGTTKQRANPKNHII